MIIGLTFYKCSLGAKVHICARREQQLSLVKDEITHKGGLCEIYTLDIRKFDQVSNVFQNIVEKSGPIDILVVSY